VQEKLLIKLNKEQSGLPCIYLVPPLIGSATVYKNMAVRMQGRCNCYGLQYPGFDTDEPFCNSVESLAGVLAAEISAHYKGGTVNLLGYSFGGAVAFEMAKCIEKTGVPVKLFIVDKEPVIPVSLTRRKDKSAMTKEWEDRQVEEELLKWNDLLSIPDPARVKLLASVNYSSLQQYRQKGILNAPVITIGAAENPVVQDMKKWVKYTRGKHQHYALPADHYSVITHTGISQLLLDEIAPFLS
jgi:thioesterase domain-containing protein